MFHLIGIVISGLIVGALAKLIMPGKDGGGFLATALLGIAGSALGTILGRVLFNTRSNYRAGWILSVVGALIVLAIYNYYTRRNTA